MSYGTVFAGEEPVSGYTVVESGPMAFGDGGYGGWSCPAGTVVLGGGFSATEPVSTSAPGTPLSAWPHYTFGPAESGWVVRDDPDGVGNTINIYAICAEAPDGYSVQNSGPMPFGDGGYGGWSCPPGTVVLGGGFDAGPLPTADPVAVSAPGTPGSVWPHYTFGPAESGWVVRDDPNGAPNVISVYAICAAAPSGYVVAQTGPMPFGDGGYGGWSCPTGTSVLSGGFRAEDTVAVSAPGTPGSVWPHYTFGSTESGWVVQDDPNGAGNVITIYVVCAEVGDDEGEECDKDEDGRHEDDDDCDDDDDDHDDDDHDGDSDTHRDSRHGRDDSDSSRDRSRDRSGDRGGDGSNDGRRNGRNNDDSDSNSRDGRRRN